MAEEPLELISEIDESRLEVRKVEIFHDGRKGFASKTESVRGTCLSTEPLPHLTDIAADPQFFAEEISKEKFDLAWKNREAIGVDE